MRNEIPEDKDLKIRLSSKILGILSRTPSGLVERQRTKEWIAFDLVDKDDEGNYIVDDGKVSCVKDYGSGKIQFNTQHPLVDNDLVFAGVMEDLTKGRYYGADINAVHIERKMNEDGLVQVIYQPLKISQ